MKYTETRYGRVFVLRLEDGEILHEEIQRFAIDHQIKAASVIVIGGADVGSKLIVGPTDGRSSKIIPMTHTLDDVHEVTGTGTIFPDQQGNPSLHLHLACGRNGKTVTGCCRSGVKTWHVLEVVISELLDCCASRKMDTVIGFELLSPG